MIKPCIGSDLEHFHTLLSSSREAHGDGHSEIAADLLAKAVAVWRGDSLGGVTEHLEAAHRAGLEELRLGATDEWAAVELELGRHSWLVPDLTTLVSEHPLRERLRAHLMLALYRSGRQAEALATYAEIRRRLVEDKGLEPGVMLQAVHRAILAEDPSLDPVPCAIGTAPPTDLPGLNDTRRAVPSELPPALPDFVGREEVLKRLLETPVALAGTSGRLPSLHCLSGPPGVGKTALAVQAAQGLRDRFPDGQLFVDLHGTGPEPLTPHLVLGRFLRALTGDGRAVPSDPGERETVYRSLLAERSVLVVLDDAAGEWQIRPLLPTGERCAALVTSRLRLRALPGARLTRLDVFTDWEAAELFAKASGRASGAVPSRSTADLIRLCGNLPLAVRAAGATLASRPHWTERRLIDHLADGHRRLDRLAVGDLDVRGSLAPSYARLSPAVRRVFRLAGLMDGPDFAEWSLSALAGGPPGGVETALEDLVEAQLLEVSEVDPYGRTRYRLHELARVYARERAGLEEGEAECRAAVRRWVLATTALVDGAAAALGLRHNVSTAPWRVPPEVAVTYASSGTGGPGATPAAWLTAERTGLFAAMSAAVDLGEHRIALWIGAVLDALSREEMSESR